MGSWCLPVLCSMWSTVRDARSCQRCDPLARAADAASSLTNCCRSATVVHVLKDRQSAESATASRTTENRLSICLSLPARHDAGRAMVAGRLGSVRVVSTSCAAATSWRLQAVYILRSTKRPDIELAPVTLVIVSVFRRGNNIKCLYVSSSSTSDELGPTRHASTVQQSTLGQLCLRLALVLLCAGQPRLAFKCEAHPLPPPKSRGNG